MTVYIAAYGDGRINFQKGRLGMKQGSAFPNDEKGLLLGKPTFTVKMLSEKVEIGFLASLVLVELLVAGSRPGGGWDVFK